MNPLLRALRGNQQAASSTLPSTNARWSVLFSSVVTGGAIVVGDGVSVLLDVPQTPVYASVTTAGTGRIVVTNTIDTELRADAFDITQGAYLCGTIANPFPGRTRLHILRCTGPRSAETSFNITSATASPGTAAKLATMTNNRGIYVRSGAQMDLISEVPPETIFKLSQTAEIGATSLVADRNVTFLAGDELEVGTTAYVAEGLGTNGYQRERVIVAAPGVTSGTTIPLTAPLAFRHFGLLQYKVAPANETVTGTRLSFTNTPITSSDSFGTTQNGATYPGATLALAAVAVGAPSVHDNRCTVGWCGHPSKGIQVLGVNDTDWTTHGYGAHLMVMDKTSGRRLQGVRFQYVGKAGQLGTYPIHDHVRSVTPYGVGGSGTKLGAIDPATNWIKQCAVLDSSNRGYVAHGTEGTILYKSVFSNCDTHVVFAEDGYEPNYSWTFNFVSGVNPIGYGKVVIKNHDTEFGDYTGQRGPSGFWLTSPEGIFEDNICTGAFTPIWLSFAIDNAAGQGNLSAWSKGCFGLSRDVLYVPASRPAGSHKRNEAGCAKYLCKQLGPGVLDEAGNVGTDYVNRYWNGTGESNNDWTFESDNLWKGGYGWYFNQVSAVTYKGWRCVGVRNPGVPTWKSEGLAFFGNAGGQMTNMLMDVRSLDDAYPTNKPTMMLSYGNSLNRDLCILTGAPMTTVTEHIQGGGHSSLDSDGGAMSGWDYYVYPMYPNARSFNSSSNAGNAIIGAQPGLLFFRAPPLAMVKQGYFGTTLQGLVTQGAIRTDTFNGQPRKISTNTQGQWGAIRLPSDGSMFGRSSWWWTFDTPFCLYGTTGSVYADSPTGMPNLNGKLLASTYSYYGLRIANVKKASDSSSIETGEFAFATSPELNFTRYQSDGVTAVTGGVWEFPANDGNGAYPNMRHAPILDTNTGGTPVGVKLPGVGLLSGFQAIVHGMAGDHLGVPSTAACTFFVEWNGVSVSTATINTFGGTNSTGTFAGAAASLSALLAATDNRYFVDTTNGRLWVHLHNMGALTGEDVYVRINKP